MRLVLAVLLAAAAVEAKIIGARVESCSGCRLNQLPVLKQFLHGPATKRFPALEITWIHGAPPTLFFVNEYGEQTGRRIDLSSHNPDSIERLLNQQGITRATPRMQPKPKPLKPTEHCIGWRAAADCSAKGRRIPQQDAQCTADIFAEQSGFCECVDGRTIEADCQVARAPFTCDDMCKYKEDQL